MSISLDPIGVVVGGRSAADDDQWGAETCTVRLDPSRVGEDAVAGLAAFSHVDVVFHFHGVDEADVVTGSRRPRSRDDWPSVGILAQRARMRPNRLGVTTCRLLAVDGLDLRLEGLDAIDATPVLDIKPYMRGFAPRGEVTEPAWAVEIMASYW